MEGDVFKQMSALKTQYVERIRTDSVYKSLRTVILIISRVIMFLGFLFGLVGAMLLLGLFAKNFAYVGFVISCLLFFAGALVTRKMNASQMSSLSKFFYSWLSFTPGLIFFVKYFDKVSLSELGLAIGIIALGALVAFIGWLVEEFFSVLLDIADSIIDLNHRYDVAQDVPPILT